MTTLFDVAVRQGDVAPYHRRNVAYRARHRATKHAVNLIVHSSESEKKIKKNQKSAKINSNRFGKTNVNY